MEGFLGMLLSIGPLGIAGIASSIIAIILAAKCGGGYPQDPASVIHNYKTLWAGKIVFAAITIVISGMRVPWIPFAGAIVGFLSLIGPLYFILQLILDAVAYLMLHGKEWCTHDRYIAANFLNMPFITLIVALSAYTSSKRLARRYEEAAPEVPGIRLGWIEMAVRRVSMITYPQTYMGSELKMYSERWEVRKTPSRRPYIYAPERRSNPHVCITGTSGVGKTTTALYILAEALKHGYRIIVIDPKGDISEAARARGWDRPVGSGGERVLVIDVAEEGVEPLTPILGETMTECLLDLINAMSVVEAVGANQKSLMLYVGENCERAGKMGFREFYEQVSDMVDSIIRGDRLRVGYHIRDAYMGIQSKLKLLLTVFGKGTSFNLSLLDTSKWAGDIRGVILDLSRIRDRYVRAVTMELLLRKIEAFLRSRGPLAFLKQNFRYTFIMVDEVHEIARSQRWSSEMTVSILEDMAREARSHGAALILVTQRLSDIPDGIRSNMGLWLTLRTDSPYDIEVLQRVVPVGRLSEIVTSMPDGYALVVEANPSRLHRMRAVTSRPTAYDEAYIIRLERRLMEYRRFIEEAQRRVEGASAPRPAPEPVKLVMGVVEPLGLQTQMVMVEGAEAADLEDASLEEPRSEGGRSFIELVIERAMAALRNREYADVLRGAPPWIAEALIRDSERNGWKKTMDRSLWSMPEEYVKYKLLEPEEDGYRLKATLAGRLLINVARLLKGAGRG
jgi:DNA polymerase III delta prime subunit